MKKVFLWICWVILMGCSKDIDDNLGYQSVDQEVKDFVWKSMNYFYLWQSDVTDLADNRFGTSVLSANMLNPQYKEFLNRFGSPKELFQHLKHREDRFSIITDNYIALEQSFQGIFVTTGMDYSLSYFGNNKDIIGVVNYVIPNSPAHMQGVKRGDIFTKVNGQKLSVNNYRNLLFSNASSLDFSFAQYDAVTQQMIFSEQKNIEQVQLKENPILLHKIFQESGKKIGYLMYNQFIAGNTDLELNTIFGSFKQENITDLILDLRYNSGGSVQTAIYLASMIKSGLTDKIFVKQDTNAKLKKWAYQATFTNNILGTPLNSLNLDKLYVITSKRTASASELIINGLSPYMQVILIGDKTIGKNTASVTVKDIIDDKGKVNPKHTWALQPIIMISKNANDFGNYQDGFVPNYPLKEDLLQMGELGKDTDPLLSKTLDVILGRITSSSMRNQMELSSFDWFKNHIPSANNMYINHL